MRTPNGRAIVTGGTRGIGRSISTRLRDSGHEVVAVATRPPDEPIAGVEVRLCDVTDERAVIELVDDLGPVAVLVNNAGVSSSNPIARTSLDEWQRNLAVNATGPFLCTRAVLPGMIERGHGCIATVASTASTEGTKYVAAYAASKHAVLGLMRVVAAETEGTGVRAVTVCPTFVRTDMTRATIDNIAARTSMTVAEAEAALAATAPHGRLLEIDDVAASVLELIATGHNGQELLLTGGPS